MKTAYLLALGILSIFLSWNSYGISLGEIQVKSKFGQFFEAEIPLYDIGQISPKELKIELASEEEFAHADLSYSSILRQLSFKLGHRDKKVFVHASSREHIQEPFISFLVAVSWPKGQLLKQYTVLFDLPHTNKKQASVSNTVQSFANTYGPTSSSDTLWIIARKLLPSHSPITIQQMMLALQKTNPEAFFRGNINSLKVGEMLQIPSEEEILAITSANEAANQVQQQTKAWKDRHNQYVVQESAEILDDEDEFIENSGTFNFTQRELRLNYINQIEILEDQIIQINNRLRDQDQTIQSLIESIDKPVQKQNIQTSSTSIPHDQPSNLVTTATSEKPKSEAPSTQPQISQQKNVKAPSPPPTLPVNQTTSFDFNSIRTPLLGGSGVLFVLALWYRRRKAQLKEEAELLYEDSFEETPIEEYPASEEILDTRVNQDETSKISYQEYKEEKSKISGIIHTIKSKWQDLHDKSSQPSFNLSNIKLPFKLGKKKEEENEDNNLLWQTLIKKQISTPTLLHQEHSQENYSDSSDEEDIENALQINDHEDSQEYSLDNKVQLLFPPKQKLASIEVREIFPPDLKKISGYANINVTGTNKTTQNNLDKVETISLEKTETIYHFDPSDSLTHPHLSLDKEESVDHEEINLAGNTNYYFEDNYEQATFSVYPSYDKEDIGDSDEISLELNSPLFMKADQNPEQKFTQTSMNDNKTEEFNYQDFDLDSIKIVSYGKK
ncbi:type IV pilus assembly protein FimV [Candidatus Nitrosacidococcus tergens]|uniref:FimV N-terminal domain-containing protein n=1 Tax=Candidatus Nitrosacidococcus tergens TaxID=553981 RepID=A0A7G1QA77_9GAMM|nr:FimV/HubP family polar landmark protein [Candidatus Nitrosacidococcus tergens]CAB1276250.1 protein of unknown function [Candidatus Nitrosacidococcus tergens]